RRRHTRFSRDWSSDVCSSDLVHDLDDFYRAGVLQYTTVAAELENWLAHQQSLASLDTATLSSSLRTPGHSLELAWRRTYEKDQRSEERRVGKGAGQRWPGGDC